MSQRQRFVGITDFMACGLWALGPLIIRELGKINCMSDERLWMDGRGAHSSESDLIQGGWAIERSCCDAALWVFYGWPAFGPRFGPLPIEWAK